MHILLVIISVGFYYIFGGVIKLAKCDEIKANCAHVLSSCDLNSESTIKLSVAPISSQRTTSYVGFSASVSEKRC